VFEILQRQVELVGIELFRAFAESRALELADQVAQPIVLSGELIAHCDGKINKHVIERVSAVDEGEIDRHALLS
jgi:hypothetical protein